MGLGPLNPIDQGLGRQAGKAQLLDELIHAVIYYMVFCPNSNARCEFSLPRVNKGNEYAFSLPPSAVI